MKVISVIFAIFILFATASALTDNSGIKLAVDWTNLNLLKKINYTKLFSNRTMLTDGIGAGNGGFFGYKVNVSNINVASVFPPQEADIIPSGVESNTPSVSINLKNFNATLNADYELSLSLYGDSKKQSKIELVVNELSVDLSINKTSGETTVKRCLLDIKSLEIAFNGYLVRSVYWMLKNRAIGAIKSNVEALSSLLSNIINTSNTFPILLNIDGMKIIGLNLTIVDRPDLLFYNSTQSRTVQIQSPVKFLNKEVIKAQNISKLNLI